MKKLLVICGFLVLLSPLKSQNFSSLIEDGFNLGLEASYEYNYWMPDESYNLDYYTEGLKVYRFKGHLHHGIKLLPDLRFEWETNMNSAIQNELFMVHNSATSLEAGYNKIIGVIGFGKRYIDSERFDPRLTNNFFELKYIKETFLIDVSPSYGNLRFVEYLTGRSRNFNEGQSLSQFTKFEEVRATFFTDGFAILPSIINGLFGGQSEALDLTGTDTRFGAFYATFQKPYSTTQILTSGTTSGDLYSIYNAKFDTYGLYEEYNFMGDHFFLKMGLNFGLSFIHLTANEELTDSDNPLFFYYANHVEMGFDIPLGRRMNMHLTGDFDWSWMLGGDYNEETEAMETQSFINSDMLFKIRANIMLNL